MIFLATAWKPQNGVAYSTVDLFMGDDFQRADAVLWGLAEPKGLARTVTIDLLRINGRTEWFDRFDWLNYGANAHPWPEALGGANGAHTALAGIHVQDCKKLHIKRLEVRGVPGPALLTQRTRVQIDSAHFERVGWPIYGDYDSYPGGSQLRGITSVGGHWWAKAWGSPGFGDPRSHTLRRFDAKVLMRGELVLNEAGFLLEDYTHHGDGISLKVAGTEFTVRRFRGGAAFFNGSVPQNRTQFPDPVRFRHLHESRNCLVEDCEQVGNTASAKIQPRALNYVSHPFTTPLVFRRCVFVKGPHQYAFQINWANVRFDDCDFVGWDGASAALELSPAYQGMPPASANTAGSRFYVS